MGSGSLGSDSEIKGRDWWAQGEKDCAKQSFLISTSLRAEGVQRQALLFKGTGWVLERRGEDEDPSAPWDCLQGFCPKRGD